MRTRSVRLVIGVGAVLMLALAGCDGATAPPEPTEAPPPTAAPTTAATEAPAEPAATEAPTEAEEATEAPSQDPDVQVAQTAMGMVLVNADGMTLYAFTQDSADQSACTGGCLNFWPPLAVTGEPVAGQGVDAGLLGTLTRADGTVQATYNGRPLYTYSEDGAPGDVNGQGVNGAWFVVNPQGELVRDASSAEESVDPDYEY